MVVLNSISRHTLGRIVWFSLFTLSCAAIAQPATAKNHVVKNLRDVGERSARFIGTQGTENAPNILLLGGTKDVWIKVRAAVEQSEASGYAINAILIGPVNARPALEVYAVGHHVTKPIDPSAISQGDLIKLLRDISKEYYRR